MKIRKQIWEVLLALLLIPAAGQAQQEFAKPADLPKYSIKMWVDVWRPDILMFGRWIKPLGDINNDGFDDVAVASFADTTFIFLGGEEFSSEPYMFLLGGGGGIAVGDFNGDRRVDIVTAIVQGAHRRGEPDPDWRGKIRFYLGKGTSVPFDTIPDLVLQGEAMESFGMYTNARRPALAALDYNGDGYSDLLVPEVNLEAGPSLRLALYQGWTTLDTVPVGYIQAQEEIAKEQFIDDVMIGDLNGDGNDDILAHGSYYFLPMPNRIYYWDLYLGNAGFQTDVPDRIISSDQGWSPIDMGFSGIIDINADGHADILDGSPAEPGDIQLFLSSRDLPNTILTNDTIVNPDFPWLRCPSCICPVGDMNGDGRPDLLVSWADYFFPYGDLYLLYPGASDDTYKTPLGVFGVLRDEHHLQVGAYPVGDVNGDGCDDVAILGLPGINASPKQYRFRIYLGSRAMQTSVEHLAPVPEFEVDLYPNPMPSGSRLLNIRFGTRWAGPVHISLVDILGRQITALDVDHVEASQSIPFSLKAVHPGAYSLIVSQGQRRISHSVIVF